MARWPVGSVVSLIQVIVKRKDGDSWMITATESTKIQEGTGDLAEKVKGETDMDKAGTSLTRKAGVDFETVSAKPTALSTLMAIMVPHEPRALQGVFDVHCVSVMGVSAVLPDDALVMRACSECKRQINKESGVCDTHPDKQVEDR